MTQLALTVTQAASRAGLSDRGKTALLGGALLGAEALWLWAIGYCAWYFLAG